MVSFRDSLILAALLGIAAPGLAAASSAAADAPLNVAQASPSDEDEDDEDEPAATTPSAKPSSTTPASSGTAAEPDAEPDAPERSGGEGAAPVSNAEAQQLVSGAPLFNPNVKVHVIEKKPHADQGKFEIAVYPAVVQVNGKFTQTLGPFASFIYHLQEYFALQVTGGYNFYNVESAFNGELVEKYRVEAQAATSLLWTWGVLGGVEVTPFSGKFVMFDNILARFSFIVNGGVGAGGTRHQLKPLTVRGDGTEMRPTYGDTGIKFMGSFGAGVRLQLGEHVALRVEVRDVVYTARMDQVNGCNLADLTEMDRRVVAGQEPNTAANLSSDCSARMEEGRETMESPLFDTSPLWGTRDDGYRYSSDVKLAKNLVQAQSSDVLNNIGLYVGVSFIF